MKIIDIPKQEIKDFPIRLVQDGIIQEKKLTLAFIEFIQLSLDAYEPLGKGAAMGRQANKIAAVLESVNGEKQIRFEDADHEIVEQAIEAMTWFPAANRRLGDYRDAVKNAQDVKTPTKK